VGGEAVEEGRTTGAADRASLAFGEPNIQAQATPTIPALIKKALF